MDPRTPISDAVRQSIAEALQAVPDGKRGALLVVADADGARAMLAARINATWKVAAGGGVAWDGTLHGTVSIAGSW